MTRKFMAELIGTFWLVFGGCGAAVISASFPELGIGFVGVAFAFGLTVLTMAYAVGPISGGHFNPAVTFGLAIADRFEWSDVLPYWIAQVVGALIAGSLLYVIASGAPYDPTLGPTWSPGGFASNGYNDLSPGGYGLAAAITIEVVLTAVFVMVILGATQRGAPAGFAPIAIGLCLTLIHLISIPVTNTSVNPARSTGVAFFAETAAAGQLWVFWLAPLVGGAIGAFIWNTVLDSD